MQSSALSKCLLLFLFSIPFFLFAQSEKPSFISPVNHDIVLAGSFGEIRSTHFHAGLDIKPSAKDKNDDIFCSDQGYVSRIKIQRGGYGRAVYIDHPNGYTTVYAHLSSFNEDLQILIDSQQREAQSYEIDIYPEPGKYIYPKGTKLGVMGNSGRSYGPHLHFEIRETNTEKPVNPILFGIGPPDNIAPTIESISIYGLSQDLDITYQKEYSKKDIPATIEIPAWRIGIGVEGYDQMNGANNKNGIYELIVYVDDTLTFYQKMDHVDFGQMDQIKAFVDYNAKTKDKSTIALTYRLPGNKLSVIDSIRNDGMIKVYQSKPRKIRVEAKDIAGNTTVINTFVQRSEVSSDKGISSSYNLLAKYDQESFLSSNPITLLIPAYALAKSEKLNISTKSENGTDIYSIGQSNIPILKYAKLSITFNQLTPYSIIALLEDDEIKDQGSTIIDDTITSYITDFGDYIIYQDTIAPKITPLLYPNSSSDTYTFSIKDDVTIKGKAADFKFNIWINGIWQPCEYKELINTLYIPKSLISPNGKILIEVEDQKGNKGVWRSK